MSGVVLAYVRLLVRDYGASFRFWRDLVGLNATYGDEAGPYADFDTGGSTLSIFVAEYQDLAIGLAEPRGERGPDQAALVLAVDDVDAVTRELEGRGVTFVAPPIDRPDWGIRVADFRDPEGNLVELFQPLRSEAVSQAAT